MFRIKARRYFLIATLLVCLIACKANPSPTKLAQELVIYGWEEDIPQTVLDAFATEYGVTVNYLVYESQEEAIEELRAGIVCDVVMMESRFLPLLIEEELLAQIDFSNIPNFKNISANFRDLAYDPGNRYSVPSGWGTTGLLVRTDLVAEPVTRWADLWDERYAGKVALWSDEPREVIALTLASLGYSVNTESPEELEQALQHLLDLKPGLILLNDLEPVEPIPLLADGTLVMAMGYPGNMFEGRTMKVANLDYIFPAEGALLWNATLIIPANSPHKQTAELFIDFLLRPEISAEITNLKSFATPNEAARLLIDPAILNDPIVFPDESVFKHGLVIMPLSATGQELYEDIWARFLAAQP